MRETSSKSSTRRFISDACWRMISSDSSKVGSAGFEQLGQLAGVGDRGQRISQLVAEHRQELVFSPLAVANRLKELGVVERRGRAAGQVFDQRDVGRLEAAAASPAGSRRSRPAACRGQSAARRSRSTSFFFGPRSGALPTISGVDRLGHGRSRPPRAPLRPARGSTCSMRACELETLAARRRFFRRTRREPDIPDSHRRARVGRRRQATEPPCDASSPSVASKSSERDSSRLASANSAERRIAFSATCRAACSRAS